MKNLSFKRIFLTDWGFWQFSTEWKLGAGACGKRHTGGTSLSGSFFPYREWTTPGAEATPLHLG